MTGARLVLPPREGNVDETFSVAAVVGVKEEAVTSTAAAIASPHRKRSRCLIALTIGDDGTSL